MYENIEKENESNENYQTFVGVHFLNAQRSYFFGVKNIDLHIGDKVVVETVRGIELGEVSLEPVNINKYKSSLYLKPVLRKATQSDIDLAETNAKDAVFAMDICKNYIKDLTLNMNLLSAEYTLDKAKIIFTYVAEERVDFRELIKVLASKLHTRIELRQIGSRDKSKSVGGLGTCGRTLCCSSFLSEFDGISINRAKNQMLAINVPKLSGHCGKLMCCLRYEDDAYTEAKKEFPPLGFQVFIDKIQYTVTGVNVISQMVKVSNEEDVKFMSLKDFIDQTHFRPRNNNNHEEK